MHTYEDTETSYTQSEREVERYVSIKEAAEAMGRSAWDVIRLIEAGEIKSVMYGRLRLARVYDVEQLGGVTA